MKLPCAFRLLLGAALFTVPGTAFVNADAQASLPPAKEAQQQDRLSKWMVNHASLTLPEMLRALANEPGFYQLPPAKQQGMRDRLVFLDNNLHRAPRFEPL
jgi:hypothetical protein